MRAISLATYPLLTAAFAAVPHPMRVPVSVNDAFDVPAAYLGSIDTMEAALALGASPQVSAMLIVYAANWYRDDGSDALNADERKLWNMRW